MISELYNHTKQSWHHVLSGESTLSEKLEVGAETLAAAAAIAVTARYGFRAFSRSNTIARTESALARSAETALPELKITGETQRWSRLSFGREQQIQQRAGETSVQLHERLRSQVTSYMEAVRQPTELTMPSWYTADVSKTLGIENAVAVMTSTCKHETPIRTFVARRIPSDFMNEVPWPGGHTHRTKQFLEMDLLGNVREPRQWQYKLYDLGRELTTKEKNAIYDLI